jgi:phage terminase large subunit-like protein
MAPAVKELERAIIGRKFRHGGHPVLRWNFENIAIETDKAGNKSFHKGKSRDRIDGAVACAMARGAGCKRREFRIDLQQRGKAARRAAFRLILVISAATWFAASWLADRFFYHVS